MEKIQDSYNTIKAKQSEMHEGATQDQLDHMSSKHFVGLLQMNISDPQDRRVLSLAESLSLDPQVVMNSLKYFKDAPESKTFGIESDMYGPSGEEAMMLWHKMLAVIDQDNTGEVKSSYLISILAEYLGFRNQDFANVLTHMGLDGSKPALGIGSPGTPLTKMVFASLEGRLPHSYAEAVGIYQAVVSKLKHGETNQILAN